MRTRFTKIEKNADGSLVGHTKAGLALEADQIMFAIGRNPHTRDLGLEKAGVEMDASGAIKVSADSQTNVPSIYAVGDVTNRANLTPVAIREGHAFADTVFGNKPWTVDHSLIATAVFSQPEMGTVGLTQDEALARTPNLDIYKSSFRPMKHTLSGRDEKMLMKMIVDADSQKVLGVHVVGPDAGELAQILGVTLADGRDQGRFRQDHRRASDGSRRACHHARTDGAPARVRAMRSRTFPRRPDLETGLVFAACLTDSGGLLKRGGLPWRG